MRTGIEIKSPGKIALALPGLIDTVRDCNLAFTAALQTNPKDLQARFRGTFSIITPFGLSSTGNNAIIPIFGEYANGRTSAKGSRFEQLCRAVCRKAENSAAEGKAYSTRSGRADGNHRKDNFPLGSRSEFTTRFGISKDFRGLQGQKDQRYFAKRIINLQKLLFYLLTSYNSFCNIIPVTFNAREYKPRISPVREPAFGLNVTNFGTEAGFLF